MTITTISEISKNLGISTRTLRYYEEIGLIHSVKKHDYSYRAYDSDTVTRIQHIIVLRKLRISLKEIGVILQSENSMEIINIFRQNLSEINNEISALSTIRKIISNLLNQLTENTHQEIKLNLLDDNALMETIETLTIPAKLPKLSMGFDIAHNDTEMMEAYSFYQKAFGAVKVAEFTPPGSYKDNLHIIMTIHGVEILLHPVAKGEEKIHTGGLWEYHDDDDLQQTINVLSGEAKNVAMESWPHWPICAHIIDKYGVAWTLHN